ncbi:MAG: hypothetical protein JNM08_14170 [Rubrivivax sp.]|nr:hypothetical protein [Rubrivivax sp.]
MIELFDADRLLPKRDWSLLRAGGALAVVAVGMAGYGWSLGDRLRAGEAERTQLRQRLQAAQPASAASTTLLADLEREARRLEAEAALADDGAAPAGPRPAQWMTRMAELATSEVSLSRIEVERGGAVRIEGMATHPQAVSRFLQAWDRQHEKNPPAPARALEVRQDPTAAPHLRFSLRAGAPAAKEGRS